MDKIKIFTDGDPEKLEARVNDFIATGIQFVSMECNTTELEYVIVLHYRNK